MTNKQLTKAEVINNLQSTFLNSSAVEFLGGDEIKARQIFAGFLYAVNKDPRVLECSKQSIMLALNDCAQFNLIPGAKQEACLVHYYKKDKGVRELQFQPMYQGLIKLAVDSGAISKVDCEVIYENDHFEYQQGSKVELVFKKNLFQDRGKVLGAYCVAYLPNGEQQIEVMTLKQIKAIENASNNKQIWPMHWDEQARKTVIKRCLKKVKKSDKLAQAIEIDNRHERPDYSEQNQAQLDDLNSQLNDVETTDVIDVTPEAENQPSGDVFDGLPSADDIAESQNDNF